jgi:hypothetical protein
MISDLKLLSIHSDAIPAEVEEIRFQLSKQSQTLKSVKLCTRIREILIVCSYRKRFISPSLCRSWDNGLEEMEITYYIPGLLSALTFHRQDH